MVINIIIFVVFAVFIVLFNTRMNRKFGRMMRKLETLWKKKAHKDKENVIILRKLKDMRKGLKAVNDRCMIPEKYRLRSPGDLVSCIEKAKLELKNNNKELRELKAKIEEVSEEFRVFRKLKGV